MKKGSRMLELEKLEFNVPEYGADLCVCLQLHNEKLFPEILGYLDHIYEANVPFHVYMTVTDTKHFSILEKLLANKPWREQVIGKWLWCNRGMDVGAFLWQVDVIRKFTDALQLNYDYLLKIHTKTDDRWRKLLLTSIVGSKEAVTNSLAQFKDPNMAFVGCKSHFLCNKEYVEAKVTRFLEKEMIGRESKIPERKFIGGTIFYMRVKVLDEMFDNPKAYTQIVKCYSECKHGKQSDKNDPYPYAFERILGHYPCMKGMTGIGI